MFSKDDLVAVINTQDTMPLATTGRTGLVGKHNTLEKIAKFLGIKLLFLLETKAADGKGKKELGKK